VGFEVKRGIGHGKVPPPVSFITMVSL